MLPCEAIICLSTGSPPHECDSALNYFYDLKAKKWKDTYKMRKNFLDICPTGSDMDGYTSVLASGAGRCDKDYLLSQLNPTYDINSEYMINGSGMPDYCTKYYNHSNTNLGLLPEKINPDGFCYDAYFPDDNYWFIPKDLVAVGGRQYQLIKEPSWMNDLDADVECLNLWK